jgi:hypothetical protein
LGFEDGEIELATAFYYNQLSVIEFGYLRKNSVFYLVVSHCHSFVIVMKFVSSVVPMTFAGLSSVL